MMRERRSILLFLLSMYVAPAVQLPQKPSSATQQDENREHPRPSERPVPGRRVTLNPEMVLLLPPQKNATQLILHFHGPAWLPEAAARKRYPNTAVLTVQAAGADTTSDAYRQMLTPAEKFPALVKQVENTARTKFKSMVLSSFSAGYGAVREILRDHNNWPRIDGVILADSMHASYGDEVRDLSPFVDFARESLKGHKFFLVTHSEVSPGAYASTAEAASFLLKELNLKRSTVPQPGPAGMQQKSAAVSRGLQILGFAGNSSEDHLDHYFALEDWYQRAVVSAARPVAPIVPSRRNKR
jgi:hypothetical protein